MCNERLTHGYEHSGYSGNGWYPWSKWLICGKWWLTNMVEDGWWVIYESGNPRELSEMATVHLGHLFAGTTQGIHWVARGSTVESFIVGWLFFLDVMSYRMIIPTSWLFCTRVCRDIFATMKKFWMSVFATPIGIANTSLIISCHHEAMKSWLLASTVIVAGSTVSGYHQPLKTSAHSRSTNDQYHDCSAWTIVGFVIVFVCFIDYSPSSILVLISNGW